MQVVLISGKKQSGKDTAAQVLVDRHGYTKIAFADLLKESAAAALTILTGIPTYKTQFDKEAFKQMQLPGYSITYRQFMQLYGTDFVRKYIDNNFWINAVVQAIHTMHTKHNVCKVVITDVRYANEIAICTKLLRNLYPDIKVTTIRVQRTHDSLYTKIKAKLFNHSSETGLDFYKCWDYVIYNYFDLDIYLRTVIAISDIIEAK